MNLPSVNSSPRLLLSIELRIFSLLSLLSFDFNLTLFAIVSSNEDWLIDEEVINDGLSLLLELSTKESLD